MVIMTYMFIVMLYKSEEYLVVSESSSSSYLALSYLGTKKADYALQSC